MQHTHGALLDPAHQRDGTVRWRRHLGANIHSARFYLAVLPALWIAPPAIDFFRRRRRRAEPVTASLVDASVNQLEEAEQARRRLHMRVSRTLWQLGWTLVHTSSLPYYVFTLVRIGAPIADIQPIVGSFGFHFTFVLDFVVSCLNAV